MPGDALASGAVRAQFTAPQVSEQLWKKAFGEAKKHSPGLTEEEFNVLRKQAEAEVEAIPEPVEVAVKIRAIQDRIIVRRVEAETKVGSLFLADETKEKPAEGIVVAVGPGRHTESGFVKPTITLGERVVFGKFSGAEVKIGFEVLLVLREEDIYLVKEN